MNNKSLFSRYVWVVLLLVLVSCANPDARYQTYTVTGETIDAMGAALIEVGLAYNEAKLSGKITEAQYKPWRDFVTPAKPAYDLAVKSWTAAVAIDNASELRKASGQIAALATALITHGLRIGVPVKIPGVNAT